MTFGRVDVCELSVRAVPLIQHRADSGAAAAASAVKGPCSSANGQKELERRRVEGSRRLKEARGVNGGEDNNNKDNNKKALKLVTFFFKRINWGLAPKKGGF